MNELQPNPLAAPATIVPVAALNLMEKLIPTSSLQAAASETMSNPRADQASVWQDEDSSFFMPERCTPLDDF